MKKEKKAKILKAGLVSGLLITMALTILVNPNVENIAEDVLTPQHEISKGEWKHISLPFVAEEPGADNDPGAGASGVLNSYVAKLTANWDANLTDVWGSTGTNGSSAGTDIPYDVNHELGVLVRWNKSHAYDTAWNLSLVRAYVNCSECDPAVSAVSATEAGVTAGDATYIYVHYYIDNSGTGYSIGRGDTVSSVSWNFEYYG